MYESKNNYTFLMSIVAKESKRVVGMALLLMYVLSASAFKYNGCEYTINSDKKSVTLNTVTEGALSDKTIIIPDSVYNSNQNYAVTDIANNACDNITGTDKFSKLVIGDNVKIIGNKAFQHFGQYDSGCVLILGKNLEKIGQEAFGQFGKKGGCKIFLTSTTVPKLINLSHSIKLVKNTEFWVKDEDIYKQYIKDSAWSQYDNKDGNKYKYPFPVEQNIQGGKWVTAMFPEDLNDEAIKSYFGEGTKWASFSELRNISDSNKYNPLLYFSVSYISDTNTKLLNIPANTPILIKAGNKEVHYVSDLDFSDGEHKKEYESNVQGHQFTVSMIGANEETSLKKGDFYLRSKDGGDMKFYEAADDNIVKVAKGKCYFQIIDKSTNEKVSGANLFFSFKDGEATAIDKIDAEDNTTQQPVRIYSITGQYEGNNVSSLPKGIHIINGKKIIIR